jgi:hypothetical protein
MIKFCGSILIPFNEFTQSVLYLQASSQIPKESACHANGRRFKNQLGKIPNRGQNLSTEVSFPPQPLV